MFIYVFIFYAHEYDKILLSLACCNVATNSSSRVDVTRAVLQFKS